MKCIDAVGIDSQDLLAEPLSLRQPARLITASARLERLQAPLPCQVQPAERVKRLGKTVENKSRLRVQRAQGRPIRRKAGGS
jgi:hypothetical protein